MEGSTEARSDTACFCRIGEWLVSGMFARGVWPCRPGGSGWHPIDLMEPSSRPSEREVSDNQEAAGKEPFFGFLEWMTVWALISGAVCPPLWRLDGVIRVLAILALASIVAASGAALVNYRRRKMFPNG